MDLEKLKIWKTGKDKHERMADKARSDAKKEFQKEQDEVRRTINTKGWEVIMKNVFADCENARIQLESCQHRDLSKYQAEVKYLKRFINYWTQYIDN